jgi:hypothetical protein
MPFSGELGTRLGLMSFLDVGAAPLLTRGLSVDGKANLMPPDHPFAVAPRVRLGYARPKGATVILAEAGAIASRRLFGCLEPYAGLASADHWLDYSLETPLAANQTLAEREGYGDGLLKAHVGLDIGGRGGFGIAAEYGFWKPLQNDPGDGFKFLDNHVLALAWRYKWGAGAHHQQHPE